MMPDMDGTTFKAKANPATRHIPVILLIVVGRSADQRLFAELGVRCDKKPFNPLKLADQ